MSVIPIILGLLVLFGSAKRAGAVDAARLYAEKFAPCHGAGGGGTPSGPPHKGNPFITGGDPEKIKEVILQGREGAEKAYPNIPIGMPGGLVTKKQADAWSVT